MNIVYKGDEERGNYWKSWLAEHAADLQFSLWPNVKNPHDVDVLITWELPVEFLRIFQNLQLVISTGAGADQFDLNLIPPSVKVIRMIEPGLTQGMTEYICFAVLGLHREMPRYFLQQRKEQWQAYPAKMALERKVGVMGLGELGQAALKQLVNFGFSCHGWSRTPHTLQGVTCWYGEEGLSNFLSHCDILICLLPLTAVTRGILNYKVFEQLPDGASLIQVGRGAQLNHQHLLDALNSGKLTAAVIDVTEPEPLPTNHPFWQHPKIWLTPHIASQTQPKTAIKELLETLRCFQENKEIKGQINRERGY